MEIQSKTATLVIFLDAFSEVFYIQQPEVYCCMSFHDGV